MSSRQQLKQLQLALISAFPSRALLERLLYFELEKNLNEITRESDLQETVFKLIQTAESQGWLVELVRAARKENPGNSELEAIALELLPPEPPIQSQQKISGNGDVVIVNRDYSPIKYDNSNQFDVFLAHNSQDKPQVRKIAQELKRRGLKPWLDEEQIPPGRPFQDEIQRAIPLVKSAAIFLGLQGLGRWQVMELRSLISMCVEKNIPVIPVLLPSMNKIPENLSFLREFHYVSFPERIDDENALYLLEWGITGQKPETRVRVIPQLSDDLSSDHGDNYIRLESSPIGDLLSDRTIDSNEQVNFDLTLDVTLTADEMRTGVEKQITIENAIINVKIPTGVTIGKILRVKGKGKLNSLTQERGNLYLKVKSSITSSDQNVAQDNITVSQGITKESLGVETLGGVMTVIIPSNTSLPAKVSEIFTTAVDGQSNVEIHLLKGNNNLVKDNVSLGTFRIDGIPFAPRGVPQIEVTFSIDGSGVISVSAKDKGTGKEASVTLQADA